MSEEKPGYKRPPKKTQFKKGQSGNPAGRPKGESSFYGAVQRELDKEVTIAENGKKCRVTKRDVIAKQLVNKAVAGDEKAIKQVSYLELQVQGKERVDPKKEPLPWNDDGPY